MCVIAAYLGDEPAAPILLEMLKREEGLAGGYYTGVATIHEGTLHCEKVVGDVDALAARTRAAELPGSLGIAHSRSPSGGDREWSHPFVGNGGRVAYVANGSMGCFDGRTDYAAAGNGLLHKGYSYLSACPEAIGPYPVLADQSCVHFSEIMCLLVEKELRGGADLRRAMASSSQDWPSEIVGLAVSSAEPDCFVAARINQPLVIAHDGGAVYGASSAIAFPEGVSWQTVMPPNCSGRFGRDAFSLHPFSRPPGPVALMPPRAALADRLMEALGRGPQSVGELCAQTDPLWPEGQMRQRLLAVYQTVEDWLQVGRVRLEIRRLPGMFDKGTAPRIFVELLD